MSVLLQVSDPHFGTERPHAVEALARLAAEQRPEVVVLSGDITQRARRSQFAAALQFANRMAPAAILAVPGNHDIPLFDVLARVLAPYERYAAAFGKDLEPSYESDDMLVLCVNTTRAHRHKHGEVSAAQVERIAQRLQRCPPQKLRIVVTHHPLHVPRAGDESNLVRGYERAAREWSHAGADAVIGGHIHLPFVRRVNERVPALARPLWAIQAGTAVSRRVRAGGGEANSVNVVRYDRVADGAAFLVERWQHDPAAGRFKLADRMRIALHR